MVSWCGGLLLSLSLPRILQTCALLRTPSHSKVPTVCSDDGQAYVLRALRQRRGGEQVRRRAVRRLPGHRELRGPTPALGLSTREQQQHNELQQECIDSNGSIDALKKKRVKSMHFCMNTCTMASAKCLSPAGAGWTTNELECSCTNKFCTVNDGVSTGS